MRKPSIALILCSLVLLTIPSFHAIDEDPLAVEKWYKNLHHMKEKVTKLHFYFHDSVSGKNPSAMVVAQSNITYTSPTFFGLLAMADDKLTVGPEPNSTLVGYAQGIYGSASLEDAGLLMTMNLVFKEGNLNGSTLSLLGRNMVYDKYREMPIVGGSGVFRMARGTATAKTYVFNLTTGNAIVEYSIMVVHY